MADPRMPSEVIAWMETRTWGSHHDQWHLERRWDFWQALAAQGNATAQEMVAYAQQQGWQRAEHQEGAAGNGWDFLFMHRAMLQLLSRDFPQHLHLLRGWNSPPTDPADTQDPVPSGAAFDAELLNGVHRIEQQPNSFASEDEFGIFVETTLRPVPGDPLNRSTNPQTGIHNYLHNRWTDPDSDINLGDPKVNLFNQRFWRLHGWIDHQWWQLRQAKGLSDTDPAYAAQLNVYLQMMDQGHPHHHPLAAAAASPIRRPRGTARSFIETLAAIQAAESDDKRTDDKSLAESSAGGDLYTYYGGKRVALNRRADQFVVRTQPEKLVAKGMDAVEQVSAHSCRVFTQGHSLERMMSEAREVGPTHHAYETADDQSEFLITDRLFVLFKPGTTSEQIDALAGRYGLVQIAKYGELDRLYQVTDASGVNPVKLVVQLSERESIVVHAEHDLNHRFSTYQFTVPTDPYYLRQWHLHTRQAPTADYDPRSSARVEDAWQILGNSGSPEVVIGITDDGCQLTHTDFDSPNKFANWAAYKRNPTTGALVFMTRDDPGANPADMHEVGNDHGTSCAGVIASEIDGALTVGAAPGCRLLPVKWFVTPDGGLAINDARLREVLQFVSDKVDVLSNSWGGRPRTEWSIAVLNHIKQLAATGGRRGKGIVFLWAAGNENCPVQHSGAMDIPFSSGWQQDEFTGEWQWVGVATSRVFTNNLAGISGVMHIAAVASTARRSHYSNYGTGISLCAPTNNVHEYQRATVVGRGIVTTTGAGNGVTQQFGGTSSATPLVAGIAGLVISANNQLTAQEVVSVLQQSASKNLGMQGYARTAPAAFDPDTTWDVSPVTPFQLGAFQNTGHPDGSWSPWFGHGRIDAAAAVTAASQLGGLHPAALASTGRRTTRRPPPARRAPA